MEKIKLTKKMLDKFVWASNETIDKIDDWKNCDILTENYLHDLGLIWCWQDEKSLGVLYRFEYISNKCNHCDEIKDTKLYHMNYETGEKYFLCKKHARDFEDWINKKHSHNKGD